MLGKNSDNRGLLSNILLGKICSCEDASLGYVKLTMSNACMLVYELCVYVLMLKIAMYRYL